MAVSKLGTLLRTRLISMLRSAITCQGSTCGIINCPSVSSSDISERSIYILVEQDGA